MGEVEKALAALDFHPSCEWDIEENSCVEPAGWVFWLKCCLESATLCGKHMNEQRKIMALKRRNLLCGNCGAHANQWITHSLTDGIKHG